MQKMRQHILQHPHQAMCCLRIRKICQAQRLQVGQKIQVKRRFLILPFLLFHSLFLFSFTFTYFLIHFWYFFDFAFFISFSKIHFSVFFIFLLIFPKIFLFSRIYHFVILLLCDVFSYCFSFHFDCFFPFCHFIMTNPSQIHAFFLWTLMKINFKYNCELFFSVLFIPNC